MGLGDDTPAVRWEKRGALPVDDMLLAGDRKVSRWAPWWIWLIICAAGAGATMILPIAIRLGR